MFWRRGHLPVAVVWLRGWTTVEPLRLQHHAIAMSEADIAAFLGFRRSGNTMQYQMSCFRPRG
jgi:hypothetical protein